MGFPLQSKLFAPKMWTIYLQISKKLHILLKLCEKCYKTSASIQFSFNNWQSILVTSDSLPWLIQAGGCKSIMGQLHPNLQFSMFYVPFQIRRILWLCWSKLFKELINGFKFYQAQQLLSYWLKYAKYYFNQ